MTGNSQELHGLMRRQRVDRKSDSMGGRISKQLIYGDKQMTGAQIKIGGIREELRHFVRKKEGAKFAKKNPQRRKIEIKDVVGGFPNTV